MKNSFLENKKMDFDICFSESRGQYKIRMYSHLFASKNLDEALDTIFDRVKSELKKDIANKQISIRSSADG